MKNTTFALTLIAISLTACSARMPTLSTEERQEPPPITEPTKDWEDWGPEENQRAREAAIPGKKMTTAKIDTAFRGRILRGCYPNGERFAENLAPDGRFYDVANSNAYLGQWEVAADKLCFHYPAANGQAATSACFFVFQTGTGFDFYTGDLTDKVATTTCASP